LAESAKKALGRVDILVNNAGGNQAQECDEITDDVWDSLLELNLTSSMELTRGLVAGMKQRRWGRIIYMSSIMALASKTGRSAYSATKAGLIGMARAQALELGPFNVTVNCLAPGPFATDLPNRMLSEREKAAFAERTALGRWGEPEELAGPALLLASEAGSYITGVTLVVDGGTLCKVF
jgi:NAD(P)-dependent dehydrogenase (short-subunit alcohol dehydrogenase family)